MEAFISRAQAFVSQNWVFLAVAFFAAVYVYLFSFVVEKEGPGPNEPPLLAPTIPKIGHYLGYMYRGLGYIDSICSKKPLPIFRVQLWSQKIYVVTSPELINEVQKSEDRLSYGPVSAELLIRTGELNAKTSGIIRKDADKETGFPLDMHRVNTTILGMEKYMKEPSATMLSKMSIFLEGLSLASGKTDAVPFWLWLRNAYLASATYAFWGPDTPFVGPKVAGTYWEFEESSKYYLQGSSLPSRGATQAAFAREEIFKLFTGYFSKAGEEHAAGLVQGQFDVLRNHGFNAHGIVRYQLRALMDLLSNTVPAAYGLISYIYNDPQLLNEIREEFSNVTKRVTKGEDEILEVHTKLISQKCPLLNSTFHEVLRLISSGVTLRQVEEDTIVSEKYVLKKGNLVYFAGGLIHSNPEKWAEPQKFEPRRFMDHLFVEKVFPDTFQAFGWGRNICPGRNLARTQILCSVGALIQQFDITPKDGKWILPKRETCDSYLAIPRPLGKVVVSSKPRSGFEKVRIDFRDEDQL